MARYVAKHVPEDSDDTEHEWLVEYEDGNHLVELTGLRAAEAHIIAFALNAVAEGMVLSAVPTRFNIMPASPGHKRVQIYEGPRDGVAP